MKEVFPLWAGILALVLIIYAFIKFREISLLEQQKYVMPEEDPNDFQNWITKEFKTIKWLLIPKPLEPALLQLLFLQL